MRSIVHNAQALSHSSITVLGLGKNKARSARQEPLCNMQRLQSIVHDLLSLAELRDQADSPEYRRELDHAVANAFMIASAVESVRSLADFQPFTSNAMPHFDIRDKAALERLDGEILQEYHALRNAFNVCLDHLSEDGQTGEFVAERHIRLLTLSMIYDLGGDLDPQQIVNTLGFKWSPHVADAVLLETFAPVTRTDVRTNWMATRDALAKAP